MTAMTCNGCRRYCRCRCWCCCCWLYILRAIICTREVRQCLIHIILCRFELGERKLNIFYYIYMRGSIWKHHVLYEKSIWLEPFSLSLFHVMIKCVFEVRFNFSQQFLRNVLRDINSNFVFCSLFFSNISIIFLFIRACTQTSLRIYCSSIGVR